MLFAQRLSKTYDDYLAVDDVSLVLHGAETVALLGPGGAGKTTVFQLLIGILQPDTGRIILDDLDITGIPIYERVRRGLGYLPQEPSVLRTLTVEQNLIIALEAREPIETRRREIVEDLLTIFGLQNIRASRAGRISGGERRRCEMARTLAIRPKFVLLDEPFAGLDPLGINEIRTAIGLLTERGIGVLITDHNIRETLSFVDRAYIIESGRILMEGSTDAVISNSEVRRAYLGANFSL
jgi:lipopolysaccharide export system ATP-binding protein